MPRGGKRTGSGRRRTKLAPSRGLSRITAEEIIAQIDEKDYWLALLSATITTSVAVIYPDGQPENAPSKETITIPDHKIRLESIKYLTDRRDGKAPQAIHHSGPDGDQFRVTVEHIGLQKPQNTSSAKAN